jgi:hypothetical protein
MQTPAYLFLIPGDFFPAESGNSCVGFVLSLAYPSSGFKPHVTYA